MCAQPVGGFLVSQYYPENFEQAEGLLRKNRIVYKENIVQPILNDAVKNSITEALRECWNTKIIQKMLRENNFFPANNDQIESVKQEIYWMRLDPDIRAEIQNATRIKALGRGKNIKNSVGEITKAPGIYGKIFASGKAAVNLVAAAATAATDMYKSGKSTTLLEIDALNEAYKNCNNIKGSLENFDFSEEYKNNLANLLTQKRYYSEISNMGDSIKEIFRSNIGKIHVPGNLDEGYLKGLKETFGQVINFGVAAAYTGTTMIVLKFITEAYHKDNLGVVKKLLSKFEGVNEEKADLMIEEIRKIKNSDKFVTKEEMKKMEEEAKKKEEATQIELDAERQARLAKESELVEVRKVLENTEKVGNLSGKQPEMVEQEQEQEQAEEELPPAPPPPLNITQRGYQGVVVKRGKSEDISNAEKEPSKKEPSMSNVVSELDLGEAKSKLKKVEKNTAPLETAKKENATLSGTDTKKSGYSLENVANAKYNSAVDEIDRLNKEIKNYNSCIIEKEKKIEENRKEYDKKINLRERADLEDNYQNMDKDLKKMQNELNKLKADMLEQESNKRAAEKMIGNIKQKKNFASYSATAPVLSSETMATFSTSAPLASMSQQSSSIEMPRPVRAASQAQVVDDPRGAFPLASPLASHSSSNDNTPQGSASDSSPERLSDDETMEHERIKL